LYYYKDYEANGKEVLVINTTGGPIIKKGCLGFTEGSLVHILFSQANLAGDYNISII
jgi:hypothetical protein